MRSNSAACRKSDESAIKQIILMFS